MPEYKAVVTGENFEFIVDDEPQYLDFTRTLYVDADDEQQAQQSALAMVREELLSQSMLEEWDEPSMVIDEIQQLDVLAGRQEAEDFIWHFPEE
jgi:hypothetical protein